MRRTIAPILSIATVIALVGAPAVLAKEWMEVTLDAPIAMGTPGGTEIIVGLTVTVPDPETGELHPVEGTPLQIRLVGPEGATTQGVATADGVPGHYTATIAIPEGGARDIEFGIGGSWDMAVMVKEDPFAFGEISDRTAQLAPVAAAAPVKVAPVEPASPAAQPAVEPAPEAAPAPPAVAPELLVSIVVLAALAVAAGVAVRRRRAPGTAPRSA